MNLKRKYCLSPRVDSGESSLRRFATWAAILTALSCLIVWIAPADVATAQSDKSVVWNTYDVTLDLRSDGSYHVTERQEIDFQGGPFTGGFADIPLGRIDSVQGLVVSEETGSSVQPYTFEPWANYGEDPGTFSATTTSSDISVRYGFTKTSNQTRTFILEYDVYGAMRVYLNNNPPNEQIWWTAIASDVTDVAPIRSASMTINLPTAISDLSQVMVAGPGSETPQDHTSDGKTWTWQEENLAQGDDLEVRLQFPPIVDAAEPSWQQRDDAQRKSDEEAKDKNAVLNVIFLGIGLLALAGGGAGLYGLWYTRGRDPHTGLVADFIPKPPDDLPPGAAGALVDERADERDVTATLVDLANRGVLKMDETDTTGNLGFGASRDFQLTLTQDDPKLTTFETELLRSLFGSSLKKGQTTKLSAVKSKFTSATPKIKEEMYQELVTRGYFIRSPEKTRSSYRRFGGAGIILVILLACVANGIFRDTPGFYWFFVGAVAILAVALMQLSNVMPRKTPPGAESAAKWRAFRKYLEDIEKYEKVAESQQIFDKYLPYAIAFGLESSWVRKFASVGASTPGWYGPVIIGNPFGGGSFGGTRGYGRAGSGPVIINPGSGQTGGGSGGGGGGIPSLQETSDKAGRTLQGSSDSLLDMFNTAAKVFSGFGGGGRGGGWGGGGGGFGGGGSHGGSSGGGGRGFH